MGLGAQYGPAEALAVVDRARSLGITLIDTAERYGGGESERLLGRALADPAVRDSVVLASKVTPIWPTRDRVAAAARAACPGSAPTTSTCTRSTGPTRWSPRARPWPACAPSRPAGSSATSG